MKNEYKFWRCRNMKDAMNPDYLYRTKAYAKEDCGHVGEACSECAWPVRVIVAVRDYCPAPAVKEEEAPRCSACSKPVSWTDGYCVECKTTQEERVESE